MKRSEVLNIRRRLENAANYLPDSEAAESVSFFPDWEPWTAYSVGKRVKRPNGKLYKANQAHVSEDIYPPEIVPALWTEVAAPGEYREIKDNMLPTEAFELGEIGWYGERSNLYRSKIPNNIYTPVTYPDGWEAVSVTA